MKQRGPIAEIAIYAATLLLAVMYDEYSRNGVDSAYTKVLWHATRTCQGIASTFGRWGIRAECAYRRLTDSNRTV